MHENGKTRISASAVNRGLQWRHLMSVLVTLLGCWIAGVAASGKVTTAPHIFEQPLEYETAYKPGEDIRLLCVADSNSQPTYAWKKDDRPLAVDNSHVIMQQDSGTITIKSPSEDDDGVYQCFVGNQFGTSVTIKTTLKKAFINPFKTVTTPTVHRVEIGRPWTLRCSPPDSYPRGSVYWGISQPGSTRLTPIETNDRILLDYEGHLRIANVLPQDSLHDSSVSYVCIANNPLFGAFMQGDDQKIQPYEAPGSPAHRPVAKMWTSPSTDIAVKGRNKKIKCIFSGLPTPKVTWSRVGGKPMGSRTNESVEGHGTELQFINVDFEDAGTYRCSATNEVDGTPVTADINLFVHAAPSWRQNKYPGDKQVDEEDDVEFICQADGTPTPTISWYINGVPHAAAPSNPRRRVESNKVTYRGVVTADAAVLQCVASNEYGHIVANAILTVIASAPSFSATPVDKKIVEGGSTVFTCRVHGAPKPRIEWKKGSNPVSGDRVIVHSSGDLEVTNARLTDNGTYFCHASNKLGRDYVAVDLLVRSPTRITDPPRSQSVNATDDVTLNCGATTDRAENLTVEWRRDGRPIDFRSSPHFRYNPRDHSLVISGSRVGDSGQFTCNASNGLDSVESQPATIVVKDRPAAPRSVRVDCDARFADITWEAGSDNNDRIAKYVVYYRDRSAASSGQVAPPVDRKELQFGAHLMRNVDGRRDEDEPNDEEELRAAIAVIPWRQYEFYVTAWNGLGESDLSAASTAATCRTPETRPARNPTGVCSRLRAARQLVIVWEPLTEKELSGHGFYYLISYKLHGSTGAPETTRVDNPAGSEVVVHQREIFRKYEISVRAANAVGISTEPARPKIGYSGEGKPASAPKNFQLVEDSLNSTYAEFSWDPIDPNPERVQGFFRGYRIIMWRASDPNNKRFEDVILHTDFDTCPDIPDTPDIPDMFRKRRHTRSVVGSRQTGLLLQRSGRDAAKQQQQQQQPVIAGTNKLWPYSRIHAAVAVLNSADEGYPSDPAIVFQTPEGVSGVVGSLKVSERGSNHLVVEWTRPIEPNGIIKAFAVVYRVAPPNVGSTREIIVASQHLQLPINNLESSTVYRISVSAVTVAGPGESIFIDGQTLEAAPPDKPLIGSIDVEDTTVLVTFSPSTVRPATNPGTIFYVEYIDTDKEDEGGPWNKTQPTVGPKAVNITNLEPGSAYKFRVVAVNGIGETQRETRSDPYTVQVGDHGLITFEPPREVYTDGPGVGPIVGGTEPSLVHASSAWFIILMIIILLLLLILLIVCIVRRTRGEMYPVQEKEKLWGRDPLAPDDKPFGEYTTSGRPDPARSQGSLDSEEKPLDSSSETDSLGEYEDPEASKFNEDGSFIGLYSGQKSRPGGGGRNTSPAVANTFV